MHEPLLDFMWIALAFVLSAPLLAYRHRREQPNGQHEPASSKEV